MEDGLSNYKVNAICTDTSGFLWLGTNEGLNRYDGISFRIFKHDEKDSTSIANNTIRKLINTKDNKLIIATDAGVDIYNPQFESFTHIPCLDNVNCRDITWTICLDQQGTLWIGSINGLFYKRKDEAYIKNFSDEYVWFKNHEVTELNVTSDTILLIGTKGEGLFLFNTKNKSYTNYKNIETDYTSISGNGIEAIFEDSQHNIWIGTDDHGLCIFNKEDSSFSRISFKTLGTNDFNVRDIDEDEFGRIWVGSYVGLLMKDKDSNEFVRYAYEADNISRLTSNSIYDLHIDNQGIIWAGTYSGGVNYCDMYQKKFRFYEHKKDDNRYLNDRIVYSIVEDNHNNLWIGTEKGGLNKLNRSTGLYEYFFLSDNKISGNNIKVILMDKEENLWIGTYKTGLYYFNPKTKKTINYVHDPKDKNSICNDIVYTLYTDKDENLWVGTRSGIDLLPKGETQFKHYTKTKPSGLFPDVVHTIYVDNDENVWLGSAIHGLFLLNKKNSTFVQYNEMISTVAIYTVYEDRNKNIWTAGNSGLFFIDQKNDTIIHYTELDGLPTNTIYRIVCDSNNLWISTTSGITVYKDAITNPYKPHFVNYKSNDGILIKQFTLNSYSRSTSDEIFFGGVDGFVSFYPKNIQDNPFPPKVMITNLKIFNTPVHIGQKFNKRTILKESISTAKEVTLSYKHKVFTIEFAALHFSYPEKNQYKYMLKGFDNDWNYTDVTKRSATYTNLDGGKYKFIITASNNDGKWSDNYTELDIRIIPPFTSTWLFYVLVFLTLSIVIFLIIRIRTMALKAQKEILEQKVKERTRELSEANVLLEEKQEEIVMQNEELFKHRNQLEKLVTERTLELEEQKARAEESDRLKSAFLANMSHEIRTPMNSILGFSNLLINEEDPKEKELYIEIINNNSEALLVLINDILDISKIESNQLEIFTGLFDVYPVLEELEKYYILKNKKNIFIQFVCEKGDSLILDNDIFRFKQIMNNLLDNAFKYTERGTIQFGYERRDNEALFFVKDTGIGIKEDKFSSIFNYFEKIEDDVTRIYRGAGIGLSICKRLLELMGGNIWLESTVNVGSTFYFTLPFSKNNALTQRTKTNQTPISEKLNMDIVIAEDEDNNFLVLKMMLKSLNLEVVHWAKDGIEIVNYIKNLKNTENIVVLMDIKMPKLNGIDALIQIREFNKRIPVIAVTAYATAVEKNEILSYDFNGYISKPISVNILYEALKKVQNSL